MNDCAQPSAKTPASKEWTSSTRCQLLGLAFAPAGLLPLAEWLSWRESGLHHLGGLLALIVILSFPGALLGLPICFIGGCVPRFRRYAAWGLVCLSVAVASFFVGFRLSLPVRRVALEQVMVRAESLIEAIRKHEAATGRPPSNLAELVPGYLSVIPTPGIGTASEYFYRRPAPEADLEGNAWMLDVMPPVVGIGFDRFIYLPKQNYPHEGWGGVLERMGTWAYVHE
ncbi:MAG: hypothetical protein WCS99_00760 [Limisphaerales bacterium]